MHVGYVRVSTEEQETARQVNALAEYGVEKMFVDKASGISMARTKYDQMLNELNQGDTVVVESLSRISRKTVDLITTCEGLYGKGIEVKSLKEPFKYTTAAGKLIMTIFAAVSEYERNCTLERQREGIAVAKKKGIYTGRKPIVIEQLDELQKRWENGEPLSRLSKETGISKTTLHRKLSSSRGKEKE